MSCSDCFKGAIHAGEPTGTTHTIGGVESYVALPTGEYQKDTAVVFLGDIFGFYTNSKLMVDSLAANGFATYFPDLFNGDPVPLSVMNAVEGAPKFDTASWKLIHTPAEINKILDAVFAHLRAQGVTKFGATGYCFGGKYAVDLAISNSVLASVTAHPSGIEVPTDLERLLAQSSVPILFNSCEVDRTWPKESQEKAEELLGQGLYAPGFKQNYYPGCTHGFAVRGDVSVPEVKHGKENAFEETVAWFRKYLV